MYTVDDLHRSGLSISGLYASLEEAALLKKGRHCLLHTSPALGYTVICCYSISVLPAFLYHVSAYRSYIYTRQLLYVTLSAYL